MGLTGSDGVCRVVTCLTGNDQLATVSNDVTRWQQVNENIHETDKCPQWNREMSSMEQRTELLIHLLLLDIFHTFMKMMKLDYCSEEFWFQSLSFFFCRTGNFHQFVKTALTKNPKKRPTADRLLQVMNLMRSTSHGLWTDGHLFLSLQHPFVSQPLSRTVAIDLLDGISNLDQVSYQEHLDDDEADAEVWGTGYRTERSGSQDSPSRPRMSLHEQNQNGIRTQS